MNKAHYREGARARSTAEFVSKLGGGHQELEETMYWMELLTESETVKPERLASLMKEADELSAIFTTCIKNAKNTASRS
jgi:four helix bundle protein